jgi:hypothetical protein
MHVQQRTCTIYVPFSELRPRVESSVGEKHRPEDNMIERTLSSRLYRLEHVIDVTVAQEKEDIDIS